MMMILKPSSCTNCVGACWPDKGFVPSSGDGSNGVLVIAEAAGENEAKEGMPLIGKAGHFLWSNLLAAGIQRDGFKVHNVLSCRPPKNELRGMPYEMDAISACSPNLDATIKDMQQTCAATGRNFVIITLGKIAFKRILNLGSKDPILREDYLCYPFWSDKYQAWVIPVDHPSHIMQGNTRLVPVMQFGFQRALEIAEHGLTIDTHQYLLDPEPATFANWVQGYLNWAAENESYLSYDIETPYKQGKSEDKLSREEDQDSWQILRCSFAYRPNEAVSIPWTAPYLPYIEELFTAPFCKVGWNSAVYDHPRVSAKVQVNGDHIDAMQCWHVLNSALDKSLGFVTPFYVPNTELWKHLSDSQPAFYNAKDADMALRNFLGIKKDLVKNGQWKVIDRHIIQLNQALSYMSRKGVLLDQGMRAEAEEKLSTLLKVTDMAIESSVPEDARKLKIYKKEPKDTTGMKQITQNYPVHYCPVCGIQNPNKWKKHATLCGLTKALTTIIEPRVVWAKPLEFKVSNQGLQKYQEVLKHRAIFSRKEKKITFDEGAILKLVKDYPSDPLYPQILKHREYQKLLSTYVGVTENGVVIGGMPTKEDGRIHTIFQHNPSTLRLASSDPNMQNIPRAKSELSAMIRNMLVAAPGHVLTATDFSGIEAVLVGFFAMAKDYIRLARIDVHSFYVAYALNQLDGRVHSSDLPLLSWDDAKLSARLAEIKSEFKSDRNNLYKHLVHAINFGQGAKGAQAKIHLETGELFQIKLISKVMDIYKELFPEIPRWQQQLLHQVHRDGYLKNPYDYIHRFNAPFKFTKVGTQWEKSPGSDANAIWAFLPQSTAAGIMKEALLRLYFDRFEEAGQYLRLTVHDELLSEVPEEFVDQELKVKQEEMGKPILQLPLPTSYGMGQYLSIGVESKLGSAWGSMKGYHVS